MNRLSTKSAWKLWNRVIINRLCVSESKEIESQHTSHSNAYE